MYPILASRHTVRFTSSTYQDREQEPRPLSTCLLPLSVTLVTIPQWEQSGQYSESLNRGTEQIALATATIAEYIQARRALASTLINCHQRQSTAA
eukprot:392266-Pleurochrysis_carterae.AAC.1